MAEILIAEDEKNIREALADLFVSSGYQVRQAPNGAVAMDKYGKKRPDLMLLDVMMPRKDGFAVLTEIRRRDPLLPIILLTALGESVDKIKGLGLGADDYVTKPFKLDVLLARVARALQRVESMRGGTGSELAASVSNTAGTDEVFRFADAEISPARQLLVSRKLGKVALSHREVGILRLFSRHPGEVLGREHLLGTLWGVGYLGSTRTLDQHIASLRRKLGEAAALIETVHGVGYRYLEPKSRKAGGK